MIFPIWYTDEWNLRQLWHITSGVCAKYHVQVILLFVYTTTCKRFVILTCRYFKLSRNTTAISQWNCRNFLCSSIVMIITISIGNSMICSDFWHKYLEWYFEIVIQASEIWDNFERSWVVFMPNITYKSCYYKFILLPKKGL